MAKQKTPRARAPWSFSAYARRRGVSVEAVRKAHRSGRLHRSIVMVNGKPKIADPALADREWAANTNISKLPAALLIARHGRRAGTRGDRGSRSAPRSDDTQQADLSDATRREKLARAQLAELKYRERAGQLVEAEEMKAAWIDHITIARTKVLGIPSKFKQRRPHQTLEDLADLDELLREALEDLAGPPTDAA